MFKKIVHISNVIKDKQYDCVETNLNGESIQIVFSKIDNVEQYKFKDVYLLRQDGGDYSICEIKVDESHADESNKYIIDDNQATV